jgi:hypothetical protein
MQSIPLTRAEREDTKHNIQTFVDLISFYGLETDFNLAPTITHWEYLTSLLPIETANDGDDDDVKKSRVITLTKYKVAAYVACLANTQLPPCPFDNSTQVDKPEVLIGGRFNVFMTKIIMRCEKKKEKVIKKLSVIQSLIQSKGGLTRPDEEFVRYAEIKVFEKLTTLKPEIWANGDDIEKIKLEIRRTVREIFTKKDGKLIKYTDSAKFAFGLPSASSNYNNSRKMYGALGHCMKYVRELKLTNKKLLEFTKTHKDRETDEEEMRLNLDEKNFEVNALPLSKAVYEFRKKVMAEALEEIPYAIPFGLSEPGKPRVITKGPPATYYILKTLQRFMHNHMRTLPTLELIGKTIDAKLMSIGIPKLDEEEKYLSGDYSDATNELEAWVTDEITAEIGVIFKIEGAELDLVKRSLTGHIMELRDRQGKSVLKQKEQVNGQLMGSILSFLWLCIANLSLVRMSKEEGEGRTITLDELEARINGDDCAFAANKEVKGAWEHFGKIMGLKPSIGKVFWTREFVTMNSRMFVPETSGFMEIPFISLGLLHNTEKSVRLGLNNKPDGENPMKGLETIGVRNQWLMMGCPQELRYAVQQKFVSLHRKLLDASLLDWFMPEWSGGLGICDVTKEGWILNSTTPMPGNPVSRYDDDGNQVDIQFTEFDIRRNEASYRTRSRGALFNMVKNWGDPKYTPRPLTSMKLPTNLDIMSVIQNIMPCKPREVLTFGNEKEPDDIYDQVFGMAAMAAYLTDEATQLKIEGLYEDAVNVGNDFSIEHEKIIKYEVQNRGTKDVHVTEKVMYEFEKDEIAPIVGRHGEMLENKKRKRAIETAVSELRMEEWERRVKHNRKVWKNNMKVGCTKLADWKFLQRRTYMKVFKGHVVGKGVSALKENFYGDYAIPLTGDWSFNETMEIDW